MLVHQVSFHQIGRIFQQNFEITANHSLKCDIFVCFMSFCGRITCTKPVIESGRKFVKSMICVALPPDSASVKLLIDDNVPLNPMLPSIAWNTGKMEPQTSSQTWKMLGFLTALESIIYWFVHSSTSAQYFLSHNLFENYLVHQQTALSSNV